MPVRSVSSGWTVIKEVTISTTPRRVFIGLTKPRELNAWFTQGAKVDLRVGGRYSNLDNDKGTFLEVVPNQKLRFTWDNSKHAPGTIVEVLLKNVRGKTVLTLIHSGFKRKADFDHYSSGESGWNWALSNLKEYLEGRATVSFEDWLKKQS